MNRYRRLPPPSEREDSVGPLTVAAEIGLLLWVLFFGFVLAPLLFG